MNERKLNIFALDMAQILKEETGQVNTLHRVFLGYDVLGRFFSW
jgi:hypothetical protein